MRRVIFAWVFFVSLLQAVSVSARPGNFERYPIGALSLHRGGAAVAQGKDVWHNAAGLGTVVREGISASVSAYGLTQEWAPQFVKWSVIEGRLDNDNIDVIPVSIDYVKPLVQGERWNQGFGLSVILPDYSEFDGVIDVPAQQVAFQIRGRRQFIYRTFWIMPGWGACNTVAKLCLGAGPAIAAHQDKGHTLLAGSLIFADGTRVDLSQSSTLNLISAAVGAQVGAQWEPLEGLRLGATLRTPVATVWSRGSFLQINSQVDTTGTLQSFVDRLEVTQPRLQFQQPWRAVVGIGYEKPETFAFEADLRFTTGLGYRAIAGPNGEDNMAPQNLGQTVTDPSRVIQVTQSYQLEPTLNFAAGGEVFLTSKWALGLGVFSDFSASSPASTLTEQLDYLSRIGGSLGVGVIGQQARTWLSVVYIRGGGEITGLGENFTAALSPLNSQTFMIMLGSTTFL